MRREATKRIETYRNQVTSNVNLQPQSNKILSLIGDYEKQEKWIHMAKLKVHKKLKLAPIPETEREYSDPLSIPESLHIKDPW